jgi:hypothetical protein
MNYSRAFGGVFEHSGDRLYSTCTAVVTCRFPVGKSVMNQEDRQFHREFLSPTISSVAFNGMGKDV